MPKSIISSTFCCNLLIFCVLIFGDTLVPIILRFFNAPSEAWLGIGLERLLFYLRVTHHPMYFISVWTYFNSICLLMWHFLLRTADNLLLFFGSGRVLLCTSFLTSVSFVLWTHVSCLSYFMCHNFWTRAISLSLHCVFRGREVTVFFCLSAGFVFRDVARGSEPMIRFLTMVKALTSLVGMSFIPRKIPWMSGGTLLLSVS